MDSTEEFFDVDPSVSVALLSGSDGSARTLLVEGTDDEVFWSRFIKDSKISGIAIEIAGSKHRVLQSIAENFDEFGQNILGLVDRDFDSEKRLSGTDFHGFITTSKNDLEVDIIHYSDSLRLLEHSFSKERLANWGITVADLHEYTIGLCQKLGVIRACSKHQCLGICFQEFSLKKKDLSCAKTKRLACIPEVSSLVTKICSLPRNRNKTLDADRIILDSEKLLSKTDAVDQVRGHDFAFVFSVLFDVFRKSGRPKLSFELVNDAILDLSHSGEIAILPIGTDVLAWAREGGHVE